MTGSAQEAEDLYQDTFLTAWEKRGSIDSFGNVRGFLMAVAVNLWNNRRRKLARHRRIAPAADPGTAGDEGEAQGDGTEKIPAQELTETEVIRREEAELIRRLTQELPERLRLVVYLRYGAELSEEEIGRVLRIPKGTVKSRLSRAKRSLQGKLEERGYEI